MSEQDKINVPEPPQMKADSTPVDYAIQHNFLVLLREKVLELEKRMEGLE